METIDRERSAALIDRALDESNASHSGDAVLKTAAFAELQAMQPTAHAAAVVAILKPLVDGESSKRSVLGPDQRRWHAAQVVGHLMRRALE